MRIAYLNLQWPRTLHTGVGKKIAGQTSMWRELGHEVRLFMHMHTPPDRSGLLDGEWFEYELDTTGVTGRLRTELARIGAFQKALDGLRRFSPDVIYLRNSMYIYPLQRLFDIAPVVVEVMTNDLQQHTRLGGMLSLYNRLTRGITLGGAGGLVCISHELAGLEQFTRFGKPMTIIGDGIDAARITPFPAPDNPVPRLLFIGSPGNPWHGVDKLVRFARRFSDVEIDVVGYDRLDGLDEPPANLHLLGYLRGQAYLDQLARADVALGSMALHRIGMAESSPLKTRECLAYGLPMVLPYGDTDLMDVENECLLSIPNREDNLDAAGQAVRDFAYRVRGKRVDRRLVLDRLDARAKETRRLEFMRSVWERQAAGK